MQPVRVFISYAWEDDEYRFWVRRLATTLRQDGVDARLDYWDRQTGQDFPAFMNAEVRNADRVLVLGSPQYRTKVHAFEELRGGTGVGWEAMLLTAQIFVGNRAKVAVAVARGSRNDALPDFLHTQSAHDLSTPDNSRGYRELLEDLRGQRQMAPPLGRPQRFEPDEETLLFEAPSGMELTLELRSWIDARWPEGKPDAIYPPWSEFEAGKVTFPGEVLAAVEASVDRSPCALVVGSSASGKSVLGASVAFKWSRITGRRAFWLDFGDHVGLSPDELHRDVRTFLSLSGANLLVLDNAQVAQAVADWAVNQVEAADKIRPGQRRLLILTRPLQAGTHHQASLQDRLASERTVLVPSAAMFAAVAVRLLGRHKLTPNWMEADYERWVHEFGGDLICFGQAVLGTDRTGEPTRAMAAKRVRETYVDPARQHDRGISILDRLCAAATLDLTVDDSALDGRVQQAVPHLIEGGQVQALERGRYRHWKLGHPGMGSLILETRARDAGYEEADLRRSALLDVIRSNPFMLGAVTIRVANPTYGGAVELEQWSRTLQTQPAILEAFLCKAPTYTPEIDRRIPNQIPWHLLRDPSPRERILDTCRRTPPHFVASFLRYAERHEPEAVRTLLRDLLTMPEFDRTATATPAGHLARFALFALERVKKEASPWLCTVLALPGARPMIRAATPTDLTALARAVCSTSEDSAATLAALLLRDWWSAFQRSNCPDGHQLVACGPIIRLAHNLAPDVADELVSWLNSLGNQFVEAMHPIPLVPRLGLALALRDTERWLVPPLWDALSRPG